MKTLKQLLDKVFKKNILPKQEEIKAPEQKIEPETEPETITFDRNHDCFIRAHKIMRYANMYCSSDFTNRVARGVKIYMDLDNGKIPQDYEKEL